MSSADIPSSSRLSVIRKYPKMALGVIVLVLALILDFGLTVFYYLLAHGTIHYKVTPHSDIRTPSSLFHHTLKPNSSSDKEGWGPLHPRMFTNSLGFRDKTIREVPLKVSHYRILMMGDSFTEGVGYDFQQSFVGIIADGFLPKGVEVLNAGVVGYSPAVYFKKTEYLLETVGLQFDHMVIFLDISDIADEVKSYEIRDGQTVLTPEVNSPAMDFVYRYSTILRNLFKFTSKLRKRIADPEYRSVPQVPRTPDDIRYGIKHDRSLWTVEQTFFEAYGLRGLGRAERQMDRLHDLLASHHIGLTVVVYPWPDQIFYRDIDSVQVRFWQDWASKHSASFINLFPEFIKDGQDPKRVIAEYYIAGDTHWNEKGHQLVGGLVLRELQAIVAAK